MPEVGMYLMIRLQCILCLFFSRHRKIGHGPLWSRSFKIKDLALTRRQVFEE